MCCTTVALTVRRNAARAVCAAAVALSAGRLTGAASAGAKVLLLRAAGWGAPAPLAAASAAWPCCTTAISMLASLAIRLLHQTMSLWRMGVHTPGMLALAAWKELAGLPRPWVLVSTLATCAEAMGSAEVRRGW